MKSDRKKRILAAILCMVMVLSSNISALAEGEVYADPDAVTQMETPEAVSETQPESAPQEPAAEEPPVSTGPVAPETPAENNEPAAPETPATPEEEAPVFSEETELTKELRDASGKLVQKVTAKLPKGAFEAETSQIEMEVTYVDSSMENYIKGMMEKKLPTDNTLGDYFLYNIQFKVNGEAKESLEPITITFEKSNLEIKDTKKANVFFFDPANPEVSGDKDELVEITQRSELLESLQAAGQSTATMEEDYDLSSIEIKEENRSGKIVLEGRKSTIYGCYVEKEPEEKPEQPEEKPADIPVLNYEDDKVTVSVTAEEAGIIPEGAELKVLPITSEDTETKEQYQEVEKKIQEKVAEEEKEVAGFLAYDITFVDKDGNEMEPNGKVKVSMNYKKAELPPEVEEKKATDAEVTVLHLEEDENGEVKQVVDMGAEQKANVDTLISTEGTKVQNVEVETESFSVFTITWTYNGKSKFTITAEYVDASGNEINVENTQRNVTFDYSNTINLEQYWETVDGYNQVRIAVDNVNGKEITNLQRSSKWKLSRDNWKGWTEYYIKYKEKGANQYTNWLQANVDNSSNKDKTTGTIYFVYERVDNSPIRIVDNIIDDGSLTATFKDQPTGDVTYTWYRSDTKEGEYTVVEKINFKNGVSNLSTEGEKLYPAYDKGARKWYKVKVVYEDGREEESEPFQVPYYSQLENGSFETPAVSGNASNNQWSNDDYVAEGGVWKSTGIGYSEDRKPVSLEIVKEGGENGAASYAWYRDWDNAAYDGKQFAEINCQAAGALYQDVLTVEGQTLNYWLSHRARGTQRDDHREYDTMYLVIMPAKDAVGLETQEQLVDKLNSLEMKESYGGNYSAKEWKEIYNVDGTYVARITSNDQSWNTIVEDGIGKYTPTTSLTRFFFMAGATAAGGKNTVGNFVDQVGFSQKLPPVEDGKFHFTIEKNFEGLGDAELTELRNKIQFRISAKKNGEPLPDDEVKALLGISDVVIKGSNMNVDLSGNLSISFVDRPITNSNNVYEITVTEENAELASYQVTSSYTTEVSQDNGEPVEATGEGATATVSNIKGKTGATISFNNTYASTNYKNVNFTKVWDDKNNEFGTRPENLDVTLHGSVTYQNTNGQTVTKQLGENEFITQNETSTHTLTGDEWKTSWRVPVYYNLDENTKIKIDYTVSEGDINSDYEYQKGTLQSGDGTGYDYKSFDNVTTTGDGGQGTAPIKRAARMSALQNIQVANNNSTNIGEPAHKKYVEYDRNAGEYVLNLDVTGRKGTATGVDVLFVIDTSGSMSDSNSRLLTKVKTLLTKENGVIDKIFKAEGNVNQAAFVSFAGVSETNVSEWRTSTEKGVLKSEINNLYADGGTNWTYAWRKASDSLATQSANGNDKVVIFLSDGKPTYTYKQYTNIFGREYWAESGSGSDTLSSYYDDVINTINGSSYLQKAELYSVYLNDVTKDGMKKITSSADGNGTKTHAQLVNGINLGEALDGILNKVIPTYKNVIITDTLSDYVEFSQVVNGKPEVTVKKGNEVLNKNQYKVTVTDKTVKVELLSGAALEDGVTYTVSFRIKPSDSANSTEYPHTGDPGTGQTSAGQKGFYSNKEASVSYEIDGDTTGSKKAEYPKPVVQLTTHKLTYEKVWIKPDGIDNPTEDITLYVTYTDGTTEEVILESSEGYKKEKIVPVTKRIRSVVEKAIDGYTPSYVYSENGTKVTVTNSYSKIVSSNIKVEKKWEGNGPESPVQVSLYQSSSNGNIEKYGETITLKDNKWSHKWENLPKSEGSGANLVSYTYAVREENIPENYTSNLVYTQKGDTTVATITNVYDENCADEDYYIANVLQTIPLTITKYWEDNDNNQNVRPSSLGVIVNGMNFTLEGQEKIWQESHTILKRVNKQYIASENLTGYENYYDAAEPRVNVSDNQVSISFVNKIKTTSIVVQKKWNDGECMNRPNSIKFKLYYRNKNSEDDFKAYLGEYAITEENMHEGTAWTLAIRNLPVAYEYQVREVNVPEGYSSFVTEENGKFVITNTLKWSIVKTNKPLNPGENPKPLEGAEFELKQNNTLLAKGISRDNGIIEWKTEENQTLENMNGDYLLVETKAPNGYVLHEKGWTLTFVNGLLKSVRDNKDDTVVNATYDAVNGARVTVTNTKLYELPETGGTGIFVYTIGGTLLLMAAALLIYKMKREEVLKG